MSRILRRPMFRGGRVDSRGTGIASGLGYEKGGSVQPRQNFYAGGIAALLRTLGPAALKYGRQGINYGKSLFNKPTTFTKGGSRVPGASGSYSPVTMTGGGPTMLGSYVQSSPTLRLLGYGAKKSPGLGKALLTPEGLAASYFGAPYLKDMYDKMFPGEKVGGREFVGEEAEIVGDPRDLPTEKELTADQVRLLEMENLYKKLMEDTKKKAEGDGEETVDIDKEKFAKLLGKDKAKGEDISNMLLSFAGKALKPEANVKTAFGEFFEEEAKRPSRARKQYDDAAAAVAINAYIAGEKSMADTKKALAIYDKKLSKATSAENSKSIVTRMNEDKGTQRSDLKKLIGNTAEFMEDNNIPGVPQQIKRAHV